MPELARPSILITDGVPIRDSELGKIWIFQEFQTKVDVDPAKVNVIISSDPDGADPIILDNGMYVNGKKYDGLFGGVTSDPKGHRGQMPGVVYKEHEPVNITDSLRNDGNIFIQLFDYGYTFCCSRLYLVFLKK